MKSVQRKIWPIRVGAVAIALGMVIASASSLLRSASSRGQKVPGTSHSSRRMADGKQWMTHNLDVRIVPSYCYDDAELNCRQYGRLYTWESARRGCESLGDGWQLPTNDDWRQMAEHYGALLEESEARSKLTFKALMTGGSSGFNAVLGGNRSPDGEYSRQDAHGFYWTASESGAATAWFYNFGTGMKVLNRLSDGEKQRAFSVRCVRE